VPRRRPEGGPATQRRRPEGGYATIWALGWIGACATLGWISLLAAVVVAAQHHLDGSADLASLAGAAQLQSGRNACAAARLTAVDNGVSVRDCSVDGADVVVVVETTVPLPFGIGGALTSVARAGPS
jgi:secretion/DNA translocation related TadE-like protein